MFGSAFFSSHREVEQLPSIKYIPDKVIEELLAGGGGGGNPALPPSDAPPTPVVTPPTPEAVAPPPPTPEPAPVTPEPPPADTTTPPKEEKQPDPPPKPKTTKPKSEPKPTAKPEKVKPVQESTRVSPEGTKPVVKKPSVEIDLSNVVTRDVSDTKKKQREAAEKKAREEAERQERAERAAQEAAYNNAVAAARKRKEALMSSVNSLGSDFSKDTGVKVSAGGGPGGESYANYGSVVRLCYDNAWLVSPTLGDQDKSVEVSITILRSGEVLSARISRRSGFTALDKSVEAALNRVKRIPRPFPDTVKEEQRTFIIEFNLKAKRQSG